jgi:hypothetical protein
LTKLIVYGDSFAGPPTRFDSIAYSWVDLLAKNLNIPYYNKAVAGNSLGYSISLFVKDFVNNFIEKDDIIVFLFTDPSRLHLSKQNEAPRTATRYTVHNHFENKNDYWYQLNKNYIKWYLLNKDTNLDYINATSYLHMLQNYARSNCNKLVVLNSFPSNYSIPLDNNVNNFIYPLINLKTASDGEFVNSFSYKDWENPLGTDIRSNHFCSPNLQILADLIYKAIITCDSNIINYKSFLSNILDKPLIYKQDYLDYINKGYLFYSKSMLDKLK